MIATPTVSGKPGQAPYIVGMSRAPRWHDPRVHWAPRRVAQPTTGMATLPPCSHGFLTVTSSNLFGLILPNTASISHEDLTAFLNASAGGTLNAA
jgi:hypothetical protein